ncbi:MAG: Rne/Rng family ribonuclease, partial [Ornithinibacter sp.]
MASDTEQTPTTDESAATKPKRRRASSKAAAPAQAPAMLAPTDTAATAVPFDDTAQAPAAAPPAKKAARKRATKKASPAPVENAAPADAAPEDAAPDASAAEPTETPEGAATAQAPAKKPARKTATRKRTSKAAKAAESAPVIDAPVEADLIVLDVPMGESEPADEIDETDQTDQTDEATPVVPSFGLLFQPPEPTVARRRRATAPSQAPSERPAPAEEAVAAAPDEAPREQALEPAQDEGSSATGQTGDDTDGEGGSRRRRRGGRGRRGRAQTDDDGGSDSPLPDTGDATSSAAQASPDDDESADGSEDGDAGSSRRRRRRRRGAGSGEEDPPGTVTRVREVRSPRDEPTAVKGSTRLEAKKQRRREGREAGRRRTVMTEAEFLSRRESVDRVMVVRGRGDRTQIGVLEDGVLVEHYVSRETTASMAGNVYLGRVQNVLPSMEAAFVDIGKGRNAVLYAGEVNWDAAGLEGGQARRIEHALKSGDPVLVQVTKDPIGHKGARLTSQISLPGRYVVYVPEGSMTGISRKLPDTERARLKGILKEIVPDSAGVIVRTAAEGASQDELTADVERLTKAWEKISKKAESAGAKKAGSGGSPVLLHGEPDLTVRVIRDVFTEDFTSLVVSGEKAWSEVSDYVEDVAPDLAPRLSRWTSEEDVFASNRIDEQIAKAMDRKVWLPSGGSLVIDRTEAMTVVDVNTGKFIGSGGNLEETVTKNNLEAAEEIV